MKEKAVPTKMKVKQRASVISAEDLQEKSSVFSQVRTSPLLSTETSLTLSY